MPIRTACLENLPRARQAANETREVNNVIKRFETVSKMQAPVARSRVLRALQVNAV